MEQGYCRHLPTYAFGVWTSVRYGYPGIRQVGTYSIPVPSYSLQAVRDGTHNDSHPYLKPIAFLTFEVHCKARNSALVSPRNHSRCLSVWLHLEDILAKEEHNLPPAWLESRCFSAGHFLGQLYIHRVGTYLSLLMNPSAVTWQTHHVYPSPGTQCKHLWCYVWAKKELLYVLCGKNWAVRKPRCAEYPARHQGENNPHLDWVQRVLNKANNYTCTVMAQNRTLAFLHCLGSIKLGHSVYLSKWGNPNCALVSAVATDATATGVSLNTTSCATYCSYFTSRHEKYHLSDSW